MDLQLKDKTALVMAASKGLGKACAMALAAEGANVVIGARNRDVLEATAGEIRSLGKGRVLAIPADVNKPEEAEAFVNGALAAFGRVDILVNNAGG
ncbi:MAG TPA: SDR family NAD(P)-dependent oxidoreductase, partial [Puia sp.]|nr:SDR family NAD(P)-dependent oxidoreductase [Puia sp.]